LWTSSFTGLLENYERILLKTELHTMTFPAQAAKQ
jgi:hypothetical protein